MSTAIDQEYIIAEITRMARGLGLPESTVTLAKRIFEQAQDAEYLHRDTDNIATACLFAATRLQGEGVSIDEMEDISRVDEQAIRSHYRSLGRTLGLEIQPNNAEPLFLRFSDKLGFPKRSVSYGLDLIQEAEDNEVGMRMAPHSLAACIIYLVSLMHDLDFTQADIDRSTGVSEGTIRNHWRDVADALEIDVPSRKGMDNMGKGREREPIPTVRQAIEVALRDLAPDNHDVRDELIGLLEDDPNVDMEEFEVTDSRHPAGVVGGAFYVVVRNILDLDNQECPSQDDVGTAMGVATSTLQKHALGYRKRIANE